MLENDCFAFGHEMIGNILQKERCDCPESVEFNIWAWVFRHDEDRFDVEKLLELRKPFPELLDSIAQLRHAVVHRVRVSAKKAYQFRTEAESLANILHNNTCARMLSRLPREAKQVIDELGRSKDLLESLRNEKLQEFVAQRRELDSLESKAVEDMLREDKEYQTLASASLEQAIGAPETIQPNASTSEHDTSSEAEVEAGSFQRLSSGQVGESAPSNSKRTDIVYPTKISYCPVPPSP